MGAADVVPGVSGGTIAVVLGIYERLLGATRALATAAGRLLRGDRQGCGQRLATVDWWLIGPLLTGILATIVLLASVIETLLEEHPETMAGLFCGLVAASAVSACRLFDWRGAVQAGLMVVSAAATFALLGLQSGPVADPSLPVLAGAGAVAVCAMILPGISGAFLLLMLGMYGAVIGIVTDLRYGEAAVFGAGAAVGLALFSSLLGWLLDPSPQRADGAAGGVDGRVAAGAVAVAQRRGRHQPPRSRGRIRHRSGLARCRPMGGPQRGRSHRLRRSAGHLPPSPITLAEPTTGWRLGRLRRWAGTVMESENW